MTCAAHRLRRPRRRQPLKLAPHLVADCDSGMGGSGQLRPVVLR